MLESLGVFFFFLNANIKASATTAAAPMPMHAHQYHFITLILFSHYYFANPTPCSQLIPTYTSISSEVPINHTSLGNGLNITSGISFNTIHPLY